MPHPNDVFDLSLLQTDTGQFILRRQRTVEIVIKQCIQQGLFRAEHYPDLIQSANEQLIKRLPLIRDNFDGSVRLETYLTVVIRNICLRIREQDRRIPVTEPLDQHVAADEERISATLEIHDEQIRLTRALRLFGSRKDKLLLCLKVYFRIRLQRDDVRVLLPHAGPAEIDTLVRSINEAADTMTETALFTIVADAITNKDGSSGTGDSLRRWTTDHLNRVIALMNGDPPSRRHTKESIGILLEYLGERS